VVGEELLVVVRVARVRVEVVVAWDNMGDSTGDRRGLQSATSARGGMTPSEFWYESGMTPALIG